MQVLIRNVPYSNLVVQATGQELEVLAKVFGSAIQIDERFLKNEYRKVWMPEAKTSIEMTVFQDTVLTQNELEEMKRNEEDDS